MLVTQLEILLLILLLLLLPKLTSGPKNIASLSADDTSVSLTTSSQTQTVTFTAVVSDNVGIDSISLTGATQTSSNAEHIHLLRLMITMITVLVPQLIHQH